ncbi:flavodoxin family protein [archaeon]|nr:MAG: flavodoxin family protein [archaeon]
MKVVAFNTSPHEHGNTYHLLKRVLSVLEDEGIETELVFIGGEAISGCTACLECRKNKDGHCAIDTDCINDCIDKMVAADGIIIGTPTHFADLTPAAKALVDRSGYVTLGNGGLLARKVGAAVVAVRRAGAIHAYDSINHLFGICNMMTVGASYWNLGIGLKSNDVESDDEGMRTMDNLGRNMAWLLKVINTYEG